MIYIPFFYSEQVWVGNGITCYGNGITSLTFFGIKHKIIIDTHLFFSARLQITITSCSNNKKKLLATNYIHSTVMYFIFNTRSIESSYWTPVHLWVREEVSVTIFISWGSSIYIFNTRPHKFTDFNTLQVSCDLSLKIRENIFIVFSQQSTFKSRFFWWGLYCILKVD